ncbi:basic salivary proline-rich protein 1-like [Cavia porcellus]|uniref:basic salivary proline-rich protein 1-like n=1 Tax=Cavia porcellus TaxID=10141 RepID=UPI002FDF2E45
MAPAGGPKPEGPLLPGPPHSRPKLATGFPRTHSEGRTGRGVQGKGAGSPQSGSPEPGHFRWFPCPAPAPGTPPVQGEGGARGVPANGKQLRLPPAPRQPGKARTPPRRWGLGTGQRGTGHEGREGAGAGPEREPRRGAGTAALRAPQVGHRVWSCRERSPDTREVPPRVGRGKGDDHTRTANRPEPDPAPGPTRLARSSRRPCPAARASSARRRPTARPAGHAPARWPRPGPLATPRPAGHAPARWPRPQKNTPTKATPQARAHGPWGSRAKGGIPADGPHPVLRGEPAGGGDAGRGRAMGVAER